MRTLRALRAFRSWRETVAGRRAERALARQLAYQHDKARRKPDDDAALTVGLEGYAALVLARIRDVAPLAADARTLEIGCGAHGLVFFAGLPNGVGVDPLASAYRRLFPRWQSRAATVQAVGEALPFADGTFDLVLSDNVVDHAHDPARILAEVARVLRPGGLLYFTVNVHHRFWRAVAELHALWNALGLHVEIGPFADHTTHLTADDARRLVTRQPFTIVREALPIAETRTAARLTPLRHPGDLAKRLFFKNVRYEIIAKRR
ncbi:MAG TPA: class I SAM-dependent methyltransferase [Polyangia bacterium]|nr:class I SAM-dependent methyltransferase [Polyangia bacterium]